MIGKNYKYFYGCTLFATLLILAYGIFLDPVFDQRDGLRPREGISIGYNDEIKMEIIEFFIINTRETDSIELRYDAIYLEPSKPGKIGIYFPYNVTMNTDSPNWQKQYVDSGTVFMKIYTCTEGEICDRHPDEDLIFTLIPKYSKFDTKNRHIHGIKVGVDSSEPPNADRFFREDNMKNSPLNFWYDNSTKREVSFVIPRTSDKIQPIPAGEPGIFYNRGLDYSNNRISWTLHDNDHIFFLDYEMPKERENFETSKLLITMSGIVMGMLIGAIGITIAYFKKKEDDASQNYKIYR